MTADDVTVFAVSLNVASRIYDLLSTPRTLSRNRTWGFVVEGLLPLKGDTARCQFRIDSSWQKRPPPVICAEPWVRTGCDWHVYEGTREMCYIFCHQWVKLTGQVIQEKGVLAIIQLADTWIVRNCQWLLNKHLVANQLELDSWDDSWGFWPHGEVEAKREFEKRVKHGGTNERRREKHSVTLV